MSDKQSIIMELSVALNELGIEEKSSGTSTGSNWLNSEGDGIESYSPVDGKLIGAVCSSTSSQYEEVVLAAEKAFVHWRKIPDPQRGEVV